MSLCRYVDRHVASVNRFDSMRELNVTNKSIVSYLSSFATQRAGWTRSPHTTLEKITTFWGDVLNTPEAFEKTQLYFYG